MNIRDQIENNIGSLSGAEKRAARTLLANYPSVGLAPVAEFALAAGTSAPTILRFITRIGFKNYPQFQRDLRLELQATLMTPLDKTPLQKKENSEQQGLEAYFQKATQNFEKSLQAIPFSEFQAAVSILNDTKAACYLLGGRFTDSIANYMAVHLRVVRPNVRRFQGQVSNWDDQLLDIKTGDIIIIFDIRRYQTDLVEIAKILVEKKARIILITDTWLSPVSKYAKVVLPCSIESGQTWDSSMALFGIAEALVHNLTQKNWEKASKRLITLENLHKTKSR